MSRTRASAADRRCASACRRAASYEDRPLGARPRSRSGPAADGRPGAMVTRTARRAETRNMRCAVERTGAASDIVPIIARRSRGVCPYTRGDVETALAGDGRGRARRSHRRGRGGPGRGSGRGSPGPSAAASGAIATASPASVATASPIMSPTPAPTPTSRPTAIRSPAPTVATPARPATPRLAYAEFLLRVNDDRAKVEGLNADPGHRRPGPGSEGRHDRLGRHPRLRRRRARLATRASPGRLLRGGARFREGDARRRTARPPTSSSSGPPPAADSAGWPRSESALDAADAAGKCPGRVRQGPRGDVMRDVSGDPIPPVRHVTSRRIVAVRGESLEVRDDRVVGEAPLEIRAAGPRQEPVAVAVTMRTPGYEAELAVGFLRTEGLLDGQEVLATTGGDPGSLSQPDDTIVVRLSRPFDDSKVAERHFVATASCGICGKASIDEVALRCDPLPRRSGRLARRSSSPCPTCCAPPSARSTRPAVSMRPGCSRRAGELIAIREDVGRHNALDKLVGSQVLAGAMPLHDRILMVSGRVSFEIVQKAAVAGIPIVCAVSAPSDLAIETAERLGVDARRLPARRRLQRLRPRRPDRPARPERPGLTGPSGGRRSGLRRAVVDELEAEAALDAQVAVGHRRIGRRGDLDDPVVLGVEARRRSRRRSTGRSCRSRSGPTRPRCRPRACRTRT